MTDPEAAIRKQFAQHAQETFAPALNTIAWALLRKDTRTPEEDEKMLYAAFASAYHFVETGTPTDHQRAEWLISRVYAILGNGREAVRHAKRCLELTERHDRELADYDKAFALEAMARASAVEGDSQVAQEYYERAVKAGEAIRDQDARRVFSGEFAGGAWHGVG